MKIRIVGSGNEVGKSAILLEEKSTILLDYGVKVQPEPPQYPPHVQADSAVLSHSHLDHCGALPFLVQNRKTNIYMNDITLELASMLIKDSMKVSRKNGFGEPFSEKDIKKFSKNTKIVGQNEHFRIDGMKCTLFHSGHIPGSSSVLVEGSKSIFYTSDIQTTDTHMLKKCCLPERTDILITESTYSGREHRDRREEERRLLQLVEEAISNEEQILMPTFAVGRAQEMIMILEKHADTIALDGMAKTASNIIQQYPYYLKNPKKYRTLLDTIKFIESDKDRKKALEKHQIIISSSGMLGGGPSVYYLRKMKDMPTSHVVFTGYLVDGTPAHGLVTSRIFRNKTEKFEVKCSIERFDFSGHADSAGLFSIIDMVQPETVVCVHGDKCADFAKDVTDSTGIQAFAPKNKDVLEF